MSSPDDNLLALDVACRHDIPDLVALSRDALPTYGPLHDEDYWRSSHRFGGGVHHLDNYTQVVRTNDGALVGFVWVDAASWQDHGFEEPWWCVNAVAVAEQYRGLGVGRQLISHVVDRAKAVGVACIYGLSVPSAIPFWEACGVTIAAPGESLVSDKPARIRGHEPKIVEFDTSNEDRFFVGNLMPPGAQAQLVPKSFLDAP